MITQCPNGHGALVQKSEREWACQTCGYSFVAMVKTPGKADKVTEAVNQQIKEMLVEARVSDEVVPWKRPWIIIPKRNYDNPKSIYKGINRWLLAMDPEVCYITPASIEKHGLKKKEGAKRRWIIQWKPASLNKEEKKLSEDEQQKILRRKRPFMIIHEMYMARDVEGLPEKTFDGEKENKRYDNVDTFLYQVQTKLGIDITEGGNRAYYSFTEDKIIVPKMSTFDSSDDYYRAVFHELAHATGHETRLNREAKKYERGDEYGKEELIAEFSAAYMAHYFGIPVDRNNAAYIDGWLRKIEGDARLLVSAAQRAEDVLKFLELN